MPAIGYRRDVFSETGRKQTGSDSWSAKQSLWYCPQANHRATIWRTRLYNFGRFGNLALWLPCNFPVWLRSPLNLAGVEQELAKPIHRYDQFQAAARNDQQWWLWGSAGAVLVSGDNGRTWQRQELPGRPALIDVALCADGRFVALDTTRRVWLSDHSATDWQAHPIETMEAVMALTCDGQNRIWVVAGFSTILSSADGGVQLE